ncbi:hypothetical protein SAMN05443575_1672 [Jatrophihabitans endophyticus]|uniref:DUF2020 domain-containing protein n=1 Tax=Jatrophihabitans endophyticus TaxID=1206085 RepID=A0A1M5HXI0_9ACTN|nr:hypothetical protein [Jatrophihabitans endophyticus]SHG20570.1 hypothetical protein SAMN05443575_1672 [Jatrophihabitans endophyticus]
MTIRRGRTVGRAVGAATLVLAVAGCTSAAKPAPTRERTVTSTVTATRSPEGADYRPPKASNVAPLPPGSKAPKGEKEGRCPYIRAGLNIDPTSAANVADIEGNRVGRTTLLTDQKPIGCRFYFANPPYDVTADIRPLTFTSAAAAFNAMVLTARAGTSEYTQRNVVRGVTGIGYRTKFGGEHGARDWAFAFATGKVMVVVHTERADTSRNALYLAQAIAGKF